MCHAAALHPAARGTVSAVVLTCQRYLSSLAGQVDDDWASTAQHTAAGSETQAPRARSSLPWPGTQRPTTTATTLRYPATAAHGRWLHWLRNRDVPGPEHATPIPSHKRARKTNIVRELQLSDVGIVHTYSWFLSFLGCGSTSCCVCGACARTSLVVVRLDMPCR